MATDQTTTGEQVIIGRLRNASFLGDSETPLRAGRKRHLGRGALIRRNWRLWWKVAGAPRVTTPAAWSGSRATALRQKNLARNARARSMRHLDQ
jgi:hypothetical protein